MAWYKTGTIAISGATVTGTGTNWTDNKLGIGPGQALLVPGAGTVKMYEILRVDSATKLTLTSSAGTVAAGSAYAIMSFYTDSVPDFARRLAAQLSYYQSQMDGWQQIMTGTGTINIEAPDGTIVAISSFKKLTDDTASKLDKNQNLNDVANKSTARTNLGLTLISSTTDETAGRVMTTGAAGLLARSTPLIAGSYNRYPSGFYRSGGGTGNVGYGAGVYCSYDDTICFHIHVQGNGQLHYRYLNAGLITYDHTVYSTGNTTKSSDGTLKAASPVCRIVKSQAETERADVDEDGFSWCGAGTANDEAAGIAITRQDVGVYVITGAAGLAEDGWRLLPPRDPDGGGDLGIVEAEERDGSITIRLYKRRWQLNDDGDIEPVRGASIDVPANSWIDVRLSMPAITPM